MAIRKSSGDSKQPCHTPVPIWKSSETCPLCYNVLRDDDNIVLRDDDDER